MATGQGDLLVWIVPPTHPSPFLLGGLLPVLTCKVGSGLAYEGGKGAVVLVFLEDLLEGERKPLLFSDYIYCVQSQKNWHDQSLGSWRSS